MFKKVVSVVISLACVLAGTGTLAAATPVFAEETRAFVKAAPVFAEETPAQALTPVAVSAEEAAAASGALVSDAGQEVAAASGAPVSDTGQEAAAASGASVSGTGQEGQAPAAGQAEQVLADSPDTVQPNGHVVCLDPAHQNSKMDMNAEEPMGPGAEIPKVRETTDLKGVSTNIYEYELAFDVSLKVRELLESRGYTVIMTRTDYETAKLNMDRAKMAGDQGAEIFVQLCANADILGQQSGAQALCPSGTNPYVANLSEASGKLSACILNTYCEATGFANLGVQNGDNMTGINWSTVPVTILQMGFMTSENDDNRMADVEFQEIMAKGIADGIDAYFNGDTPASGEAGEQPAGAGSGTETPGADSNTTLPGTNPNTAAPGTAPGAAAPGTNPNAATAGTASGRDGVPLVPKPDAAAQQLYNQIKAALPQDNGEWEVCVRDLSTGAGFVIDNTSEENTGVESTSVENSSTESTNVENPSTESTSAENEDEKRMQAASLIKLYIMGAVYERYDELAGKYGAESLDSLLHAMITVSDNDAANTLASYLGNGDLNAGMSMVTDYCLTHGYMDSHMGRPLLGSNEFDDNYTSAQDCGLFLARVYAGAKGTAAGESMPGAARMYELLKQQTRLNKIPSQLPQGVGVYVANKTGELADVENDAGIIYHDPAGGKDLVVCFLSQKLASPGNAQQTIGTLAASIYNFYNG